MAPLSTDPEPAPRPRGGPPLVPIGCGLVVILLVLVALAAFVWPGFWRAKPPTITDPLALIPADSNWIVGADFNEARRLGLLEPTLAFAANPPPAFLGVKVPRVGEELAAILNDCESMLVASRFGKDATRAIVVLTAKGPVDVEKVKHACRAAESQQVHGYTVYRAQVFDEGRPAWLAFPSERLILLSHTDEMSFAQLLAGGARPPHPARDLIDEAKDRWIWGVIHNDEGFQEGLKGTMRAKEFAPLLPVLPKARGAVWSIQPTGSPLAPEARIEIVCGSDADAAELLRAAQKTWKATLLMRLGTQALLGAAVNRGLAGLAGDVNRTAAFAAEGPRVVLTIQVSEKTYQLITEIGK
jgi:hypothetical protein